VRLRRLIVLACALTPLVAAAEQTGLAEHLTLTASARLRAERVDWFDPVFASDGANRYGFYASQLRAGARLTYPHLQAVVEFQDTRILDLPDDASAPIFGGLGPGAAYFAHTPERDQGATFVKQANLTYRRGGFAASLGRMEYSDGLETQPGDRTLAALKRMRIAERLVGPFGYTHVTRSLDAAKLVWDRPTWNTTAFVGKPTFGGYEISANRSLDHVSLGGIAFTAKSLPSGPPVDLRAFHLYYRDARDGPIKVDNRPLLARAADDRPIAIHTFGGHALTVLDAGPGALDALAWLALQTGDWGQQAHRSHAFALELGYQLPRLPAAPWLRVGWNRSSGDTTSSDGDHSTFFQILPTPRIYAQTPFYNAMNNDDLFAQLIFQPHALVNLRFDWHQLYKSQDDDFVYGGGGASNDELFGFTGLPGSGSRSLANLAEVALTLGPWRRCTLYAYYGRARGRGSFSVGWADSDANYFYVDLIFRY
jgi:hypothetical protein